MRYLKLLLLLIIVGCGSTKELKGMFVNLEKSETPKNSAFKVALKGNKTVVVPNEKGDFKIKYPNTGESVVVSTDKGYTIIEEVVPVDTKEVIVLIDDVREMVAFVKADQDFDEEYSKAKKMFLKLPPKIDQFSVFPGCEIVGVEQYKRCFQKKINKHIRRHFDSEIANEIGMASGRKRIFTVFEIDKQGKAKIISVKAPHPRLKKEGERIIKKLPLMKPAINRNKPVNIKYALPITFNVQ